MWRRRSIRNPLKAMGIVVWFAGAGALAHAQVGATFPYPHQAAAYAPAGPYYSPGYGYCPPFPAYAAPQTSPGAEGASPGMPSETAPDATAPMPETAAPFADLSAVLQGSTQSVGGGGAVGVASSYIDVAQVFTHFRLRVDAGFDNPTPDRAEYFYAKCGCFQTPDAKGPPLPETNVDFQDIRGYLEWASTPIFSGFVEVPYRFLDFEQNEDTSGLADMNLGVKAVLLTNGEDFLTLQVTGYLPTGDADRGLGTAHESIEPGLLFYEQHTDRLSFYGEAKYWIPIDGSDFAGEIGRYGVGTGYDLARLRGGAERFTILTELVGWHIFDGQLFNGEKFLNSGRVTMQESAEGDAIVNLKLGLRYTLGQGSFAASWGHALTTDVWYDDIGRFEYRRAF
jgi:hypothetical protein